MHILLTRPEADAERSAEQLSALGHTCVIAPLFEIAATQAEPPAGNFTALLATSAHAFEARLKGLTHLPLYVVGERTADAAQKKGFHVVGVAADGERLATKIGTGAEHFLYMAGRERRPELEALLTKAGHRVTPWIVYETRSVSRFPDIARDTLQSGQMDAVLHFSTRSAALYRDLARGAGLEECALHPAQIAISPRAAQELAGAPRISIAPTPDLAGLISALKAL